MDTMKEDATESSTPEDQSVLDLLTKRAELRKRRGLYNTGQPATLGQFPPSSDTLLPFPVSPRGPVPRCVLLANHDMITTDDSNAIAVGRWSMLKRITLVLVLVLVLMMLPLWFLWEKRATQSSHQSAATVKVKSTSTNRALSPLEPLNYYLKQDNTTGEFLTSVEGIKSTTSDNLLDVVVIGFAKSGTSTLRQWLDLHPQISMLKDENHHLGDAPGRLIQELYRKRLELQTNRSDEFPHYVGFKNPNEIRRVNTSMAYLRDYFPSTKLIVAVRHPVTWFESLWNYSLMYLGRRKDWLHNHLQIGIGGPHGLSEGIQTGNAEWHVLLALLGKTNATTQEELALLKDFLQPHEVPLLSVGSSTRPAKLPNPIFLVETTQMADENETRAAQFRQDMQQFLQLGSELPPILHSNNNHDNNGTAKERPGRAPPHHYEKINVCAQEFDAVRAELVRIGAAAGQWIGTYFIESPEVFVSSPEYLKERLAAWAEDPCENGGMR